MILFIELKSIINNTFKKELYLNKIITVDIYSDTICPWCYIGYVKFNEALKHFDDVKFEIIWRPFQLNPDMPLEGIDRNEYLNKKFGGREQAYKVYKRIEDEGKLANIHFQFYKIK
ncbi:MAG: DsbA family protein, partial [Gammaproteobacteria bacterium]